MKFIMEKEDMMILLCREGGLADKLEPNNRNFDGLPPLPTAAVPTAQAGSEQYDEFTEKSLK